ncbi:MAG: methylmalonyl-CoA mutase, partial [Calditrichaeota bacterium]
MQTEKIYKPKNKVRIVTAASLFDGHDAAINIMRRIIQSTGCEVIHLGHDRSVQEVVNAAIQEDAQAIAMTSYQGGHMEYFKYMYDLLQEKGAGQIKIFGGGGGVILPDEIEELHTYGITRIYSPDDGREMGLQGMINDLVQKADFPTGRDLPASVEHLNRDDKLTIGRLISAAENKPEGMVTLLKTIHEKAGKSATPVLGITGTGGAGKSSLIDELVRRFLNDFPDKYIGIVSVDPSKRKTGGALLGDRIRMNAINDPRVYMRSLATRQANLALSKHVDEAVRILKAAGYDFIILETSGIGQSDTEITDHSDVSLYVMTPEFGAATQLEKIDMLDYADMVAINKFDKRGARDALRDVRKQYQRNHQLWDVPLEKLPVFATIAAQFNDPGTNTLYRHMMDTVTQRTGQDFNSHFPPERQEPEKIYIIPPKRVRYLSEIAETNRAYNEYAKQQAELAEELYALNKSMEALKQSKASDSALAALKEAWDKRVLDLDPHYLKLLREWPEKVNALKQDTYTYQVRNRDITVKTYHETLAHTKVPKVATPRFRGWGDLLYWMMQENLPGTFPFAAGIYPFKREGEDPTRMFAGEGGPERTNRRFHYVSLEMPAKRLSTAFDSVTLYGHDPDRRPDIYGKIGNSGVSICSLDDAKKLYSGFNLADPKTSVSMTINGPAPMMLAFFMNAAID